jgi:FMN-binding protein
MGGSLPDLVDVGRGPQAFHRHDGGLVQTFAICWPALVRSLRTVRSTVKEVFQLKPLRSCRSLVVLFSTGALALPAVSAGAAASASTALRASSTKTLKLSGNTVPAQQWGTVTVNVTMQTTSNGTSRSQFIMSQSLPILRQEFLKAQSSKIQMVSGATLTSRAFVRSLQSALLKAHA